MPGTDHHTDVIVHGEGITHAVCACGWRSAEFGADKQGAMYALQAAQDAGDLHEWETSFGNPGYDSD